MSRRPAVAERRRLYRRAVQIGVSILNGQKPASTVELLPSKLITRDNVAEYKGWTSERKE